MKRKFTLDHLIPGLDDSVINNIYILDNINIHNLPINVPFNFKEKTKKKRP